MKHAYLIFIWYLLYVNRVKVSNPKLAIIAGLIVNAFELFRMFHIKETLLKIILFIIINVCIKVIPLYTIRNTKIVYDDIFILLGLFCIYLIWLFINDLTTLEKINSVKDVHPLSEIIINLFFN